MKPSLFHSRHALLLGLLFCFQCHGITVDDILEKHIRAIGGEKAFRQYTSRVVTGTIQIKALGVTGDIVIRSKAPDKQVSSVQIKGVGEIREGFDGRIAWSKNPFMGVIVKKGHQLEQAKLQADFYRDIEWKTRYSNLEYQGTTKLNNRAVHVVVGKAKGGNVETHYFDAETFLVVQMVNDMRTNQGMMKLVSTLSDFRKVDGIVVPFSINLIEPAQAAFTVKVNKVEHNIELNDSIFEKPTE